MFWIKLILITAIVVLFYGVILSTIAKLLGVVVHVFNVLVVLWKERNSRSWLKTINKYNMEDAIETDIYLHYNLRSFWNFAFSTGGYEFGIYMETLSSAIGKKIEEKTLHWFGWIFAILVIIFDVTTWFKGGHFKASIKKDVVLMVDLYKE